MTRKPSRAAKKCSIPWLETARRLFEVDGLSHSTVAARVGVSRGRISQVAKEYAWARGADRIGEPATPGHPVVKKEQDRKAAVVVVAASTAARAEALARRSKRRPRPTPHSDIGGGGATRSENGDGGATPGNEPLPAAGPPTCRGGPSVQKPTPEQVRAARKKAEKAALDARFRAQWEAGAAYAELRAAFGLVSDHAVLIKSVKLGLAARAGDKPPMPPRRGRRSQSSVHMMLERRLAAQERMAAAGATSDVVASAKLFLQRKGVVIYAASVVDGAAADPDLLKVDGRPMMPTGMIAHAVRLGFDPENIVPLLRRLPADAVAEAP